MNHEAPRVFFGGSGRLGKVFLRVHPGYLAPSHHEVDITDPARVSEYIADLKPSVIVHAAAVVGRKESEADREQTYRVNVAGTANIAHAAESVHARMIYLSSVAVFDGAHGPYKEDDVPNPAYYYGWTKLLGEQSVAMTADHVIVRTDFFDPEGFKYSAVFTDHICSKMPVIELADIIDKLAVTDVQGVLHVGGERDTLFHIMRKYFPEVQGITIAQSSMPDFPRDFSLDISRLRSLFPETA